MRRLNQESAFVGRKAEIGALEQAWKEAAQGSFRAASIGGEPGIGKTRIAAKFAERASAAGALVLYGRSDGELAIPVQPFAEAFDEFAAGADGAEAERLREAAPPLARIVPALRERPGGAPAAAAQEPAEDHELFNAASALLAIAAERGPVLLIVDDLHWADLTTTLMVRYLASNPESLAMLVVTYRSTEVEPGSAAAATLAGLERQPGAFGIELEGLARGDSVALAGALAGHELDERAAELAELVHAETAGNPLFATQLLRNLAEVGAIDKATGRWELRSRLEALELPGSVSETLRRRVERLGPEAAEVLGAAAVLGPDFEVLLLERISERNDGEVRDALDRAVRGGIVAGSEEGRFSFTHPLITRVLYEGAGSAGRGATHRRAALALEEEAAAGVEEPTAELARHWLRASPPDREKTREWCRRAGRLALERFEADVAAHWFEQALELSGGEDGAARCDLLIGLGIAQRSSGQAAFRETLLEAARLAAESNEPEQLAAAALANNRGFASASGSVDTERIAILELALEKNGDGDGALRARLLATLAAELSFSGDWDRRVALSDEALAIAHRLGDRHTLSMVLTARFVPIWMPETLEERLENSEENVRVADQLGRPLEQFGAVHWHSVALVQAGRMQEAADAVEREAQLARRLGDPTALWIAAYDRGNLAQIFGRLEQAEESANEAFQIATESGQPDALSFFGSQLANVRYDQGRLPELQELLAQVVAENPGIPAFRSVLALAYVESGLHSEAQELVAMEMETEFSEIPRDVTWLAGHTIYAHVCAAIGETEAATVLRERLRPWAEQIVYTGISAWGDGDHALGALAGALGERDCAIEHLGASRERAQKIGAPVWAARTAVDLAQLLTERGASEDCERASGLLDGAAADARRLDVTPLATRAENLRAHLQAREVMDSYGQAERIRLSREGGTGAGARKAGEDGGPPRSEPQRAALRWEGDTWSISHSAGSIRLRDAKGVRYLAELLSHPGVERHAVDLQDGPSGAAAAGAGAAGEELPTRLAGDEQAGPLLDEEAKRTYRRRIEELEAEIEEAEGFNDSERAARAREELEFVGRELSAAVGLGGRDRKAASSAERARVNVTRALRKTLKRIAELDSGLGEHLERSVKTGTFCVYEPAEAERMSWEVEGP